METELVKGDILEGKYVIGPRLGAGGMGVVYQAEHLTLGMQVAIKVLHPSESEDPRMIARFKAEARSAAAIRHQNIVEVTDFGLTPDRRPFFVMAHLKGESLAQRLDLLSHLSERQAVEIVDQILSGLSLAHQRGVIHRDLKPENVFLAMTDDGREVVKILDFGIAKILGGSLPRQGRTDHGDRQLTLQGTVLGTPGYMAPETINCETVDGRADLFAVGVLLYEMLTGRRPFTGVSPYEIMSQTVSRPVPRPTAIRSDISPSMERLILTALAKDPLDRIQTSAEFIQQLTAAAVGRVSDDARPCRTRVGMPSIAPAPISRDIATEALSDQSAPAPVPAPIRKIPPARPRPTRSTRPSGRRRSVPIVVSPIAFLFLVGLGATAYYFFFYQDPFKVVEHELASSRSSFQDSDEQPSAAVSLDNPSSPLSRSTQKNVTLWLEITPNHAVVLWNGTPVSDRPLVVSASSETSLLSVSAPGYVTQKRRVVPDRERTFRISLKKKTPSKRGKKKR